MTDEHRFEKFIGRAARELDPPPAPPRDAMWAAITAARNEEKAIAAAAASPAAASAPRVTPVIVAADADPSVIPFRRKVLPQTYGGWLRIGAPLAAMLVIGVGLGRLTSNNAEVARNTQTPGSETPAQVAQNTTAPATTDSNTTTPGSVFDPNATPVDITDKAPSSALVRSVASGGQRSATGTAVNRGSPNASRSGAAGATVNALPYRMAAIRHLARTEVVLVSLQSDVREGRINEVAARAADLLVNTRLLLDSPAALEPELNSLLDDLEQILAQVATISPTRSAEEVDMIQNAMNQRDVLLRLHAATAGPRLSGT